MANQRASFKHQFETPLQSSVKPYFNFDSIARRKRFHTVRVSYFEIQTCEDTLINLIWFWVIQRRISLWLSLFLRRFESLFRLLPMSIFIKISLFHASKSVWIFQNFEIVKMEGRCQGKQNPIWEFDFCFEISKNCRNSKKKQVFSLSKIFHSWQLFIILNPNCMLPIFEQILIMSHI